MSTFLNGSCGLCSELFGCLPACLVVSEADFAVSPGDSLSVIEGCWLVFTAFSAKFHRGLCRQSLSGRHGRTEGLSVS